MTNSDIHITLNDALQRASAPLQRRILHSVDLLRKSEKLAMRYDAEDGFFLAFSGGKDSQALYHVAKLAGVKFRAHINFTSVDPPQLVRFVKKEYPDCTLHAPKKSIYDLAVDRGILPSMRIRWCCADLKEQAGAGKVTLIGIRKQESTRRAKRHEVEVSNRQFSGNLAEFFQWQETKIKEKEEALLKKMHKEGKKVNEDFFSADKQNEVRCIGGKDSILVSPIFEWTEKDVWEFLNNVVQVKHCILYDMGYHRIGCILCPMSNHKQKLREIKDFPYVKAGWIRAIKKIREGGGITRQTYTTAGTEKPTQEYGRMDSASRQSTLDWSDKVLRYNMEKMPEFRKKNVTQYSKLEEQIQRQYQLVFLDSPSLNGNRGGKTSTTSRQKTKSPKRYSTGG